MAKAKPLKEKPKDTTSETPAIEINEIIPAAPQQQWMIPAIAGVAGLAVCLAVYLLRLDRVFGLVVDDAWYVLLAKSMATGHGYTLINSPSPGIVPFYPPVFPAVLSLFYRLSPNVPGNIWLLKSVSIASMMAVGVLAFWYYKRDRGLPLWVSYTLSLAIVLYPAIVFLATSTVMSECFFTLVQLGVIVLVEKTVRDGKVKGAWPWLALAGALAGIAFLTRSAGVGLLAAAFLYLFKEKLAKHAIAFAVVVAIVAGPWVLYSRSHQPTPEQQAEQGANIVQPYSKQLWQRVAGQPLSGTIEAGDLPDRVQTNLSEIAKYDFGGFVFFSLFRPMEPGEPIRIPSEGRMISIFLTVLALIGYVAVARERLTVAELAVPLSIGVTLIWGWEQFRLLLPLVPFLLFYLLMGVRFLARLVGGLQNEPNLRREAFAMLAVAGILLASNLYGNYAYISKKYDPVPEYRLRWIRAFDENIDLMNHIANNVPKDAVIATQNPALLHLFTGHKTVASDDPAGSWTTWNRIGVRYLARTSPLPLPPAEPAETKYRTVYRASGNMNLRLVDLGTPGSRPAWGQN